LNGKLQSRLRELQRYFQPQTTISLAESKFELFSTMESWVKLLDAEKNSGVRTDLNKLSAHNNVARLISVVSSAPTAWSELWLDFLIEVILSSSEAKLVAALATGDMQATAVALIDVRAAAQLGTDICPSMMVLSASHHQPLAPSKAGTSTHNLASQTPVLAVPQYYGVPPPPWGIREPLVRPYPLSHVCR
jgi:hypothetical protein